ncbi:hypothetical protein NPX13_g2584 [Xylaria arbuscula]|uniref:Uncharacterized protein n=1 Tax=Xylaria arbuscula TaxID=114810 RepID=A0A9W8NJT4_9PEZI|nr:hypothetical protein NPX13_g2584 [Xylaria arbuscula]
MVATTANALRRRGSVARPIQDKRDVVWSDTAILIPHCDADRKSLDSLAEQKLRQLFQICLRSRTFYLAARGKNVFWQFASEHWDTFGYVSPEEAENFIDSCVACRERWSIGRTRGESARLLDEFVRMHEEMLARGAKRRYRIAIRPSSISLALRKNTRRSTSCVSPATAALWPPEHFTKQEVAWLCHDHIISQLYGITFDTKLTKAGQFPQIPNANAHPLDIRLFLAFTALVNFDSHRNTSICMAPITFWDDDERRDWYRATGGAARFCWTTWEFSQWAKNEFRRGREAVAGLCHFVSPDLPNLSSSSLMSHSTQHCATEDEPWKCVGVLIRKVGNDSYQLVMEDAHHHRVSAKPGYYGDTYGGYADTGMDFKAALLEDVATLFNITAFWHGGDVPNAFEGLGICLRDTVSSSCSFVFLAAQGKVPTQDLSEEGWEFSQNIPEQMTYWEERDEYLTEEDTTECDDSGSEYCEDR